jgi:hypothetical protein
MSRMTWKAVGDNARLRKCFFTRPLWQCGQNFGSVYRTEILTSPHTLSIPLIPVARQA